MILYVDGDDGLKEESLEINRGMAHYVPGVTLSLAPAGGLFLAIFTDRSMVGRNTVRSTLSNLRPKTTVTRRPDWFPILVENMVLFLDIVQCTIALLLSLCHCKVKVKWNILPNKVLS